MKLNKAIGRFVICINVTGILVFGGCKKEEMRDDTSVTEAIVHTKGLHLGLVGFSSTITTTSLTEDVGKVQKDLLALNNDIDATALGYGVKVGVSELQKLAQNVPLDQAFIVAFTDGFDNRSSELYFKDGITVPQPDVIKHTADLIRKTPISSNVIKCYTIGYKEVQGDIKETDLKTLAVNGSYASANSSTSLTSTFQKIANSLLSTSKNFSIVTNPSIYLPDKPKLYEIVLFAEDSMQNIVSGKINAEFTNSNRNNPSLKITYKDPKIFLTSIDNIITGTIEKRNGEDKAVLSLKNLRFEHSNGKAMVLTDQAEVKVKNNSADAFKVDAEDSKAEQSISKNIAVVLVLDCSSSIKDFTAVKNSANQFIQVLVNAKR